MVYDRIRTAKIEMFDRIGSRADYVVSFVTDVAADSLGTGSNADIQKILRNFEHFERISYLRVSDSKGRIVFRMAHPGIHVGDRIPDPDIFTSPDNIYDISRDIIRNDRIHGTMQLGMSLEGVKESIQTLLWRGIALGVIFLILLNTGIWLLTMRLGKHLESLLALAERINSETLPVEPQVNSGTDIGRIAVALREMHARLRAEETLRKQAETQKDDFFAMTVHDIKQPLTSLKAALDMLFSDEDREAMDKAQANRLSQMAAASLKTLNTMVVDVLNMAKLNSLDYTPVKERVHLAEFLRECAGENLISVKAAGKKWFFSMPEDIGNTWLFGDRDLIKRLMGNLVLNAIQYTPEGGSIKMGARFLSSEKAALYISDDGAGIPDNFREQIFQKYRGLGKSAKNIGLGLAFCQMVAKVHSAVLDVRSETGKGTEISLVIAISRGLEAKPDNGVNP